MISADGKSVNCQLSDALEFYTQTHFIKTVGISDLHSHFVDRSIMLQSSLQMNVRKDQDIFILGHLLDFDVAS